MIRQAGLDDLEAVNRLLGRDFPGCDFSEVLAEPLNICLLAGESGAVFAWRGPGIYEVHVFFGVRGKEAFRLGHAMLARMKAEHDAKLFWALVPAADLKVKMFTRLMGWKSHGMRQTRHGPNELFVQGNA